MYPTWDVAVGPYGHYFASASADRTARIWSVERNRPLRILTGTLHMSNRHYVNNLKIHDKAAYSNAHSLICTTPGQACYRLWVFSNQGFIFTHF